MEFWEVYAWGGGGILLLMTVLWLVSIPMRNVSIVDSFWGLGFVVANGVYFGLGEGDGPRKWAVLFLVALWGLRLSIYLALRNWGKGEDFRYQKFRQDYGPHRYWWLSYFQVFLLQGVLMWLISAPLAWAQWACTLPEPTIGDWGLNRMLPRVEAPLGWLDYAGIAVWAVGLFFEAVGDWQLARFKADAGNKGKVMDRGLWRYTRHPNYFGDAAVWWGFGLMAVSAGGYWAALGALLMTGLIVKVSGVALLEKSLKHDKPQYAEYIRRTSAFFPWFPKK